MIQTDEISQREAKEYVLKKPMIRPKRTIWSPVLLLLLTLFLGIGSGIVISRIANMFSAANALRSILIIFGCIMFALLLTLKKQLIFCVECYQHYAPEEYRRFCLCKPTCSEYAILVLKKYCLIKAIYLIHIRLTKTCTGNQYKVDFP